MNFEKFKLNRNMFEDYEGLQSCFVLEATKLPSAMFCQKIVNVLQCMGRRSLKMDYSVHKL